MAAAIVVRNLSKTYRLGGRRAAYATLRDALGDWLRRAGRGRGQPQSRQNNTVEALRDVSFSIEPGQVVGVIGRNGAGKSTLLKILSRITEPTRGEAWIRGRVGSLLEVGTGFHPELTGRDNVFLNGAILGMSRREIAARFDAIVAFAELDRFMDTPVKYYSSGMYMRLAFAVAAHLEPEILIVDEVLAVGDAQFQKRCLGKMSEVACSGRTVLFVSHNLAAVQKLCHRALLLEAGKLVLDGPAADVTAAYLAAGQNQGQFHAAGRRLLPASVEVIDAWLEKDGQKATSLLFGDDASVVLLLRIKQRVRFSVELVLRQQEGLPVAYAPSGLAQDWELHPDPGLMRIRCHLPRLRYASGSYSIDILLTAGRTGVLDQIESALSFYIEGTAVGDGNWTFQQSRGQGFLLWDVRYAVESFQPE
jgi:lipopolysaccharide transport system ATP-binding protein